MVARLLTVEDVSRRSGLAESTVRRYLRMGMVPDPDRHMRGQPRWYTGTITAWLSERGPRRPPARPTAECGTSAGYRAGCGCSRCLTAHNDESRTLRRRAARIPDELRAGILADLAEGGHITEVAAEYGFTQQRLHRQGVADPDWRRQLDAALMAGRDPSLRHGTEDAYRHNRCRCPECRAAHHPR